MPILQLLKSWKLPGMAGLNICQLQTLQFSAFLLMCSPSVIQYPSFKLALYLALSCAFFYSPKCGLSTLKSLLTALTYISCILREDDLQLICSLLMLSLNSFSFQNFFVFIVQCPIQLNVG